MMRLRKWHVLAILVFAGFLVRRPELRAQSPTLELLKKTNPVLAEESKIDKAAADKSILTLFRIGSGQAGGVPRTGATATPAEEAQIAANPNFALLYPSHPAEVLNLLRSANELIQRSKRAQNAYPARVALVIGNQNYSYWPTLNNTIADASLVTKTLSDLHFVIVGGKPLINLDKAAFDTAISQFITSIGPNTIAIVYYAGHGVQINGSNYLVPTSAKSPSKPWSEDDYYQELIDVQDTIFRRLDQSEAALSVIILDACRDHPSLPVIGGRGTDRSLPGLRDIQPKARHDAIILYATAPDQIAQDGKKGQNGPLAVALAKELPKADVPILDTFGRVHDDVYQATGQQQDPWMHARGGAGILLAGASSSNFPEPSASITPAPSTIPPDESYRTQWTPQRSGSSAYLNSVFFIDAQQGWIVGAGGEILSTSDGGKNWVHRSGGGPNDLQSVVFTSAHDGVVVGWKGTILVTHDGGSTWKSKESKTLETLMSVSFVNSKEGWIAGDKGIVLHTKDGGDTWNYQNINSDTGLWAIKFVDQYNGWTVGDDGKVYSTSDGGQHWKPQKSGINNQMLMAVSFVDALNGHASGTKGLVLSTSDGGKTWTKQDSESVSGRHPLFGIHFISPNTGWAVGQFSTIISTVDGGLTWDPRHTDTSFELTGLFVLDGKHGWAVGGNGAIMAMTEAK